jgi:hypothetical protein
MSFLNEQGNLFVAKRESIFLGQAADRLAIRELVETYAHCADRGHLTNQMALFTTNAHFVVYMNDKPSTPSIELHSREALAPVFAGLKQYKATKHFVGQNSLSALTGDTGIGEAYCLAYYVRFNDDAQRLRVASIRYRDTYVKRHSAWLFAERQLYIDWQEERAL